MVDDTSRPTERPAGPPRRPPPAAHRWLIDAANADELRAPARVQELMDEAADRIRAVGHTEGPGGLCDVVVNDDDHSLTVHWNGPLPETVEGLLRELRRHVTVDVHPATYSSDELREEANRITGLDLPRLRVTSAGPMPDFTGLRVTLDVGCEPAQASREITSPMPLEFEIRPPATALAPTAPAPRDRGGGTKRHRARPRS